MPAKHKRMMLFDRGADAILHHWPDAPRCYVCPICLRPFIDAAVDAGVLTLEHAPPRSLVARPVVVLTCADCNNRSGHAFEADTAVQHTAADFQAGSMGRAEKGQVEVDGRIIRGEVRAIGTKVEFQAVPGVNRPVDIDWWEGKLRHSRTDERLLETSVTVRLRKKHRPRAAMLGALKAGYLGAFAKYGYLYIAGRELNIVRQQILEPDAPLIASWGGLDAATPPARLCLWRATTRSTGVLREVECVIAWVGRYVVLLPCPTSPPDFYIWLAELASRDEPLSIASAAYDEWPRSMELRLDYGGTTDDRLRG